jgi:microcystin-dependent protein
LPRAPDGSYSLPSGTLVTSGDTILPSQHNPAFNDVAQAIGNSLDRDGSGGMRAALQMGGNVIQNLSPGVNPTDAATVGQLSIGTFPVGSVIEFAGSSAPTGWLVCGGQSLSRTDYAALFAVIGTAYGSVDGSSFSLPDCRGRVSAGRDFTVSGSNANRLTNTTMTPNGTTLGATGGGQTHTLTESQMPAHTHSGSTNSVGDHAHSGGALSGGTAQFGGDIFVATPGGDTGLAGGHSHTFTTSSSGSGSAHPIVQPTILLNKIIKV